MLVSKLIPLLVMGSVGFHGKDAIKERFDDLMNTGNRAVTKQRMMTITSSATLAVVRDGHFNINSKSAFKRFVRRAVKLKNKGDPSKDMWGVTFRYKYRRGHLTVASAGPDKRFGTKDDLKVTENLYDY